MAEKRKPWKAPIRLGKTGAQLTQSGQNGKWRLEVPAQLLDSSGRFKKPDVIMVALAARLLAASGPLHMCVMVNMVVCATGGDGTWAADRLLKETLPKATPQAKAAKIAEVVAAAVSNRYLTCIATVDPSNHQYDVNKDFAARQQQRATTTEGASGAEPAAAATQMGPAAPHANATAPHATPAAAHFGPAAGQQTANTAYAAAAAAAQPPPAAPRAPAAARGPATGAATPATVPLDAPQGTLQSGIDRRAAGNGGEPGTMVATNAIPEGATAVLRSLQGKTAAAGSGAARSAGIVGRSQHLLGRPEAPAHQARGLLGELVTSPTAEHGAGSDVAPHQARDVYLNVTNPFCVVAVGVQGAGKSHSLSVILENCLIHAPPFICALQPVTTVVFHYDPDPLNFCEAATVGQVAPGWPPSLAQYAVDEIVVLVSPSYYTNRKAYYANQPRTAVRPLLFRWAHLTASHLKSIMRVDEHDAMPLYMSVILDLLRKMQKTGKQYTLDSFFATLNGLMENDLMKAQTAALSQRCRLLESLVLESQENRDAFDNAGVELEDVRAILAGPTSATGAGPRRRLVIIDLTDPMLSGPEANAIFQVVLAMFVAAKPQGDHVGKLLVLDEAHKYVQPGGADPLSQAVVSLVRQMRHHGMRVAISTQSPKAVPSELLELCSVALLHRFQSREWFTYLQGKLHLSDKLFDRIAELDTGSALAFSLHWPASLPGDDDASIYIREIRIRPRLTIDAGVSRQHH